MRVAGHPGRARTALALAASALSAGLVVITAPPADTATSGAVVAVVLDEWKLAPAQAAVRVGRVSFVVRNDGSMAHEFVVLRSDRRAGGLPVKGGKAVETGRRGELSQIASGVSKRLTLTLRPGRYVLLCNLLGHYQAGQFAALRVR
jgi:uncharacterized cupredoxin-like copper-binding protein